MAYIHKDIPLIQKSYDTYKLLHEYTKVFPKGDRHTLGDKMKFVNLELLECLMEAEVADHDWKEPLLYKANRKLRVLQLFVRLAHEISVLDEQKYLVLSERLLEIGRMIGGWMKTV